MNENYDDCHHRKTTCTFIYTKWRFFYILNIQKQNTFQKARQFPLRLFIQKAIHLTLWYFHEIFEVGILIQKA